MLKPAAGLFALLLLSVPTANAEENRTYMQLTVGGTIAHDSRNSGRFSEDYDVPLLGSTLPQFTAYRFDTEFDTGGFAALTFGRQSIYGPFRSELEFSWTQNGVAEHGNFIALGQNLNAADAGILTAATTPTGTPIGDVLSTDDGDLTTYSAMVNAYYDITVPNARAHPYLGAGFGVTRVEIDFQPSDINFANQERNVFGYQFMIGVDYDLSQKHALHAGFRYRSTLDIEVETSLIPSKLDVEADLFIAEIGWRRNF